LKLVNLHTQHGTQLQSDNVWDMSHQKPVVQRGNLYSKTAIDNSSMKTDEATLNKN